MKKNNGLIEIGDYVSFSDGLDESVIYKVLDIHEFEDRTYILYNNITGVYYEEPVWKRVEYVTNVFKFSKKINCEEK